MKPLIGVLVPDFFCLWPLKTRQTKMERNLAKALYDNMAECSDELAFRKGDVVTVMDKNVVGSSGWWMCSLYGRQGLAPANRLQLLPQAGTFGASLTDCAKKRTLSNCHTNDSPANIYQIPSVPWPSTSNSNESMEQIYKVPSTPLPNLKSPILSPIEHNTLSGNKASVPGIPPSQKGEVYDIPNQSRRTSLFSASTTLPHYTRKASLLPISELERRFDTLGMSHIGPSDNCVYAVPPPVSQDPSYDIPVPSSADAQQRLANGYNTLPNPRKSDWIYAVPVSPEKPGLEPGSYSTMPAKAMGPEKQIYDTLPMRDRPASNSNSDFSLYDIPKQSSSPCLSQDIHIPPKVLPRVPICNTPAKRESEDSHRGHVPLECRGDSGQANDHGRGRLQLAKIGLVPPSFRSRTESGESLLLKEEERGSARYLSAADNQRISTASSSSTSSCDSLALSSSSPELLREVSLSQEEASRSLLELQEAVCLAVPRLMEFVSSRWRVKEHLGKHLEEIKRAAEAIASSVTCFLNFTLAVKGNACRLTDGNLQTRIHKQLSIVEDSGLILQQTVNYLSESGWSLDTLSQNPGQAQVPDQLERFVMVARTLPEDVKRLVSILNANGKLLFRPSQKEAEAPNISQVEIKANLAFNEQEIDPEEDDSDYVQLQTKKVFEKQQKAVQGKPKANMPVFKRQRDDQEKQSLETQASTEETKRTSLSEHCRLYFGALQKAISGFVGSLMDGQPPEKFISHSKLVIMVGQRLVDTLCKEAQSGEGGHSLLCTSNYLCALLKQLAVATKKAALHFPDKQALQEAQDFAKELAQRAQQFRRSLDL